jgi:hypothetical protein
MNEQETKLIAEFIGRKGKYNTGLYTWKGITVLNNDIWYSLSDAKFHSSWDWLIPVVEKIENIKCSVNGRFGVYISSNNCAIQSTKLFMSDRNDRYYFDICDDTKFNAVYKSVIEFIKWYNTKEYEDRI